jgi:hypothetical protein
LIARRAKRCCTSDASGNPSIARPAPERVTTLADGLHAAACGRIIVAMKALVVRCVGRVKQPARQDRDTMDPG